MPDTPRILGILLADVIIKDAATGKLSLINCFAQINAIALPTQSAPFFVMAQITDVVGSNDNIHFGLSVTQVDTKQPVLMLNSTFTIPEGVKASDINEIIWPVPPLIFTHAGDYKVSISVGNTVVGERTFKVNAPTQSPKVFAQNVTGA